MGVTSSLYVALSGLNLSQAALGVVSNNISNVNTPGYSRQRINLATMPTWHTGWGQMGTGVTAQNISRYHDEFLARSMIVKSSELGAAAAGKDSLDTLEVYFNESDGNGINAALNDFFATWESLSDEATLDPTREEQVGVADTLAKQVAQRRSDLDGLRTELNGRVASAVDSLNTITQSIAKLNGQIMVNEDHSRRQEANDLRDTRDALMLQLSEIVDYDYWEDPINGAVNITFKDGPTLVANGTFYEAGVGRDASGDLRIIANNRRHEPPWPEDVTSKVNGGALGGWVEFRDRTMKDLYLKFESFVDNLVFQANHQHSQGVGQDMYTDTAGTSEVSNHPAFTFAFDGRDNDLKIAALVPHLENREPYSPASDPENITLRFVKGESHTNGVTSTVAWNDDPKIQKWEITVTLPTDGKGNITATSEDVARHINDNRTSTLAGGPSLPPRSTSSNLRIGDFISAQAAPNNNWDGLIQFPAGADAMPRGPEQYQALNRSLAETAAQGHHLSYGAEYAGLTTAFKHLDNDVVFTALEAGDFGETISVEYALPRDQATGQTAADSPLGVTVHTDWDGSQRIVVSLGTDANGHVSTKAADIVKLINDDADTRDLVLAQTPEGQSGLGYVEPLDETHLDRSGFFEIVTYLPDGEGDYLPQVHRVTVDPTDSLKDVADRIGDDFQNGIPGLRAELVTDHEGSQSLRLIADTDQDCRFAFGRDTSGALAVLGINNLFTGDSSSTIAVNPEIARNPRLLAAGRLDPDGLATPGSNENGLSLAGLKDQYYSFYNIESSTIGGAFNALYSDIGATSRAVTSEYDFASGVMNDLTTRQDTLAGVNIDEELADVLRFQYMYQASAKMITTVDEMMQTILAMK